MRKTLFPFATINLSTIIHCTHTISSMASSSNKQTITDLDLTKRLEQTLKSVQEQVEFWKSVSPTSGHTPHDISRMLEGSAHYVMKPQNDYEVLRTNLQSIIAGVE